jgi:poly(3-hydroxybutyrate) depolymerase
MTLDVPGQGTRTALVHLPSHTTSRPLPLVIVLHGAYGSGAFMERYSGFSQRAYAAGFAVVYPSAGRHFWTLAPGSGPDDVAFIGRLLDQLLSGGCFDAKRVSAAGVSNGGGLAARLACELSGRLAAIAMVAGGYSQIRDCHPDHPVSILEMHGTADPVVPYRGGACPAPILLTPGRGSLCRPLTRSGASSRTGGWRPRPRQADSRYSVASGTPGTWTRWAWSSAHRNTGPLPAPISR